MAYGTLEVFSNTFKTLFYGRLSRKTIIEKGEIIDCASRLIDDIDKNTLPALTTVVDSYAAEINEYKRLLPELAKMMEKEFKDHTKKMPGEFRGKNVSIFYISKSVLEDLVMNKDRILTVLNNNLQQIIGGSTTTIKDMSIINFLDSIAYVNNVVLDLALYSTFASVGDEKEINRKIQERVVAASNTLVSNLTKLDMHNIDAFLKELPKASTIEISKVDNASADDVIQATKDNKEQIVENGLNNFVGNPIYHIRLWMADRDHNNYKQNLIRKEVILNKIAAIRSGSVKTYKDQNVVIDNYLAELAELEKKIADYQKSPA